jgi:hypothetical protein
MPAPSSTPRLLEQPPGFWAGGQANEASILIEHHLAVSVDLDDWSQKQVPGWQGHHAGGHREAAP